MKETQWVSRSARIQARDMLVRSYSNGSNTESFDMKSLATNWKLMFRMETPFRSRCMNNKSLQRDASPTDGRQRSLDHNEIKSGHASE
eukprot:3047859-Amphidinium_carterae.2